MNIMAEENVMDEVMNLLEVEPAAALPAPGPDIPALREKLAILVSTGKCKDAIGVNLTHEQVRRLEEKDVMRHYKRYETYVGAKTNETMIDSFLSVSVKTLGAVVRIKDPVALHNELKKISSSQKNWLRFLAMLLWDVAVCSRLPTRLS